MLFYKIFQMQYYLLYNHISYLRGMLYLTNKIDMKHIKLTSVSKQEAFLEGKKEEKMESKLEANQKKSWKKHQKKNWKQTQKQT